MLTSENEKISYIGKRSLDNEIRCLGKNIIYIRNKFDCNPLHCKLPIDCIQNNDRGRIQMIKELIDVKEGNSYVPFFHNNDLETTFDYLSTYSVKHFAPTPVEFCGINFYYMSWQTWNKSGLIVVILCHSPASDMLEFDFHVLILHLIIFLRELPHVYRDLRIILFTFSISLLKLSHELYLHLHICSLLSLLNMCSLLYLLNMRSLLKCEYLFCN